MSQMLAELEGLGIAIPVFVGGRINQVRAGSNTILPTDVSDAVAALGVRVCVDVESMLRALAPAPGGPAT